MSDIPVGLAAITRLLTPLSCCDTCFDVAHTWTPSCIEGSWSIFSSAMVASMTKIYPPLYLIGALLRKEKFAYFKMRYLQDVIRSSLAIAVNGSAFVGMCCILRRILGRFYFLTTIFIPGFISSLMAINIERKERQGVLSLYMCNQAIEMLYNMMKERGYIIPVPYGEVWLFSIATALTMYLYRSKTGMKRGILKSLVSFFIGPNTPEDMVSFTENQRQPWLFYNRIEYKMSIDCIKHSLKAFVVGYALQALPSLPTLFRKPGSFLKVLLNPHNVHCGLFLGSYVAIFKTVEYALPWIRKTHDDYNALIAGGLSGLSMLFYRSSVTSLYLASKIVEILYQRGKAEGLVPSIPYATVLIYTISTGLVFHGCVFETHHVRTSYWRYLNAITDSKFYEINRHLLGEVFKLDSTRLFPAENIYRSLGATPYKDM